MLDEAAQKERQGRGSRGETERFIESDKRHSSESGPPIDFMKDVKPAGHSSQGSLE